MQDLEPQNLVIRDQTDNDPMKKSLQQSLPHRVPKGGR